MNLEIKVPDMACSACAEAIAKAVLAVDPAAVVDANPDTKVANVSTDRPEAEVKSAIAAAGYSPE